MRKRAVSMRARSKHRAGFAQPTRASWTPAGRPCAALANTAARAFRRPRTSCSTRCAFRRTMPGACIPRSCTGPMSAWSAAHHPSSSASTLHGSSAASGSRPCASRRRGRAATWGCCDAVPSPRATDHSVCRAPRYSYRGARTTSRRTSCISCSHGCRMRPRGAWVSPCSSCRPSFPASARSETRCIATALSTRWDCAAAPPAPCTSTARPAGWWACRIRALEPCSS